MTQKTPLVTCIFLPFAAGYFLSYLFRTINGPIADLLMVSFHLDTSWLGLLTSAYFLTFAICQLPVGILLDRFGPKRVQVILLNVAALGAAVFAMANSPLVLIIGRGLIGIGTAAALMAGLKALAQAVSKERLGLANGLYIMCGGIGASASTMPIDWLTIDLGWRGTFLVLAIATSLCALAIQLGAPAYRSTAIAEHWRDSLAGLVTVYRRPAFWRFAPLSACIIGTAFAVHGLWAARWMEDVDHFPPHRVLQGMLLMGAGLTVGAGLIGWLSDRLRMTGIRPATTFAAMGALFIALQTCVVARLPLPSELLWFSFAAFGGMTALSYRVTSEYFTSDLIGRANAALNVLHIGAAFLVQAAMGMIVSRWQPGRMESLPPEAYRTAFGAAVVMQVVAFVWFVRPDVRRVRLAPPVL
jgi:MFS family permease